MCLRKLLNYEDTMDFFTVLSFLPNITHLEFEHLRYHCILFDDIHTLSSRQLTDLKVVASAQGLTKIKQLKYFALKILQ